MSRDPSHKLCDAVRMAIANLVNFAGALTVAASSSRPWASVTFYGARHRLIVGFEGPGAVGAAADLLARLDDLEIALPGLILAGLALCAESRSDDGMCATLDLEALTIDEE